ncbi:MAG: hypothetical protein QOG23_2191 [Blastocatellia bacterium]|jgi:hypothetical protein|nr:hypothetical protein [Blastocatellia bacterium]
MLFKSNVPMAHRVAFFLAGLNTLSPLHRLPRGGNLNALDFLPAALFWLLVVYQWRERKTLRWQLRNAEGYGHHTPLDMVEVGLDRLPDSVYLLLAILSAISLVWIFTRG